MKSFPPPPPRVGGPFITSQILLTMPPIVAPERACYVRGMSKPLLPLLLFTSTLTIAHGAAAPADEPATITLELTIQSGKLSVAADKRDTRKLRVDAVIGGAVAHVEDRLAT